MATHVETKRILSLIVASSLFLGTILLPALCRDQGTSPPIPKKILKSIDSTTRQTAKAGRAAEVEELIAILSALGHSEDSLTKLRAKCDIDLGRARASTKPQPRLARKLADAAKKLAGLLPTLDGTQATALAGTILRLDNSHSDAQRLFGRIEHEGVWLPADMPAILKRRGEILTAIQRVKKMSFAIEVGESDKAVLKKVLGRPGSLARWKYISLHSSWSPGRTRLILEDLLRALALSQFVRGGPLELPEIPAGLNESEDVTVHLDSKKLYLDTIDILPKEKVISGNEAGTARKMGGLITSSRGERCYFDMAHCESLLKATLLCNLGAYWPYFDYSGTLPECMRAGHLNWLCLTLFGTSVPNYAWYEITEENLSTAQRRYAGSKKRLDDRERQIQLRLTRAGLKGCRSWLVRLVKEGQDPPFERFSEIGELGKMTGTFLLKATILNEYLQERNVLDRLLRCTAFEESSGENNKAKRPVLNEIRKKVGMDGKIADFFAAGAGETLAVFERRWREWLLPGEAGLVQKLTGEAPGGDRISAAEKRVLHALDGLRKNAWDPEKLGDHRHFALRIERSLSRGALAHAVYLDRYPDQAAAWPAAHEEYTDREGFSADGCRAGLNSVIAPGPYADNPEGAIDAWMGTFYHRLPLLDPGLVRVGWGATKTCAVLDVGSLVLPTEIDSAILWPFGGMKNVPRSFNPELPNPVPGENQAEWGYPVTLQRYVSEGEPFVTMRLFEGTAVAEEKEVACYFSTPAKPTNEDIAPSSAFCLIPKSRLKAKCTYTVEAVDSQTGETRFWRFTTGR